MTSAEKIKFESGFDPRRNFARWIRGQFPELKGKSVAGVNYPELEERLDEAHEAAMLVLGLTMERSGSPIVDYYSEDLKRLERAYEKKDFREYAGNLNAFVDAIEVE